MVLRKLLFLVCFSSVFATHAQTRENFSDEWAQIDTLIIARKQTKSALEQVNLLYAKAKQQGLGGDRIKALAYRLSLENEITDQTINNSIHALQQEIAETIDLVAKSILQVLMATTLENYFNRLRWQLINRKATTNFSKPDILTWGIGDFKTAISENYLLALSNNKQLQETLLNKYGPVIVQGTPDYASETMFDLLAAEALSYFKQSDLYAPQSTNPFIMNDSRSLSAAKEFSTVNFRTPDETSLPWQAIKLYQQLLAYHLSKNDLENLVRVDLERIVWINSIASFSDKNAAFEQALKNVATKFPAQQATSQAWYLLARIPFDKAEAYNQNKDTSNRNAYLLSQAILENAIKKYPGKSAGAVNMRNLLAQIQQPALSAKTEKVNVPGKPFRALVTYRNTNVIYGRILKIDTRNSRQMRRFDNNDWKAMRQTKVLETFTQELPGAGDHQTHTAEIKVNKLPLGDYALFTSSGEDFDDSLSSVSVQLFSVSNLSYLKSNEDIFVLDRQTGEPVNQATVEVRRSDNDLLIETLLTDERGFVHHTPANGYEQCRLIITKGSDQLALREPDFIVRTNTLRDDADNSRNTTLSFFIDRDIYRPGQQLYFKAIVITRNNRTRTNKLMTGREPFWIYLNNANKSIDSLKCIPNDFGSIAGAFRLPAMSTGSFSIYAKKYGATRKFFPVEEYKRPTFYATIERPRSAFKINEQVSVSGMAKGFAGNAVDGAKVKFRVTRNARVSYSHWPFAPYRSPASSYREIVSGETTTDAAGRFSILFRALANDITDSSANMVFDFLINADITDANGETHSTSYAVPIGFVPIEMNVESPDALSADSLKNIHINVTNLSGEKQNAAVAIKMYKLHTPERVIRQRLWEKPDQFIFTEKEFLSYFPTDEYQSESDYRTWDIEKLAWQGTVNTASSDHITNLSNGLPTGYYRLEATTTASNGKQVKNIHFVQLFSQLLNTYRLPVAATVYPIKNQSFPGDTVIARISISVPRIYVINRVYRNGNADAAYSILEKRNGLNNSAYTITNSDKGGITIMEAFVYDNRVYAQQQQIFVPWSDKQLNIAYSSFRNKTAPGANESWSVTVKNNNNEKSDAELMTSMYDVSLDQFSRSSWQIPYIWPGFATGRLLTGFNNFAAGTTETEGPDKKEEVNVSQPPHLLTRFGNSFIYESRALAGVVGSSANFQIRGLSTLADDSQNLKEVVSVGYRDQNKAASRMPVAKAQADGIIAADTAKLSVDAQPRKNFNETAFFMPQLHADSSGTYHVNFTMPESVTTWKWRNLAHTKDLAFGLAEETIITQKTLMVQPNVPRFIREGDQMELTAKISNLSDKELSGQVTLELIDATTNTPVDGWFQNVFPVQYFTAEAGQSTVARFPVQIPFSFNRPLIWRVTAAAGNYSDGEENIVPVVTNRVLVTESMPLPIAKDTTQTFHFSKLADNTSETLTHQSLTFEYTTNPAWYAVQALPYLIEYPYECAEQTFNRLYANLLAGYIVNKQPAIKTVFEQWQKDTASLQSNLDKNPELKQVLLQETPWVIDAQNETQQQKNIALLFNAATLSQQADVLLSKVTDLQSASGGFSWFKGGLPDRYMTTYILTGIGKLKKLGALTPDIALRMATVTDNAIRYLDQAMNKDYEVLENAKTDLAKSNLTGSQIEYLYARSFFAERNANTGKAYKYYYEQGKKFWQQQNNYHIAMLGLVYLRNNEGDLVTGKLLPAIVENAVADTAKASIYWKNRETSFWYTAPVEHQCMMIAFLAELNEKQNRDELQKQIDQAKTWLLLNKQVNNWKTTVATADACYALLQSGSDWLAVTRSVTINSGNNTVVSASDKATAGTGYIKKAIQGAMVTPAMANITVTVNSGSSGSAKTTSQPSWGSVYWQYIEDMDKITANTSPLSVTKKLFVEKTTAKGKALSPVVAGEALQTGDKVMIRMEIRTDRDMDYVQLKDSRASCMEPVNVLSGYKWQDGIGYYESTKDVSSNFFIDHLAKGTYVFEYPVFITHTGTFSTGIASIQCMYAPEFGNHSESFRINVELAK